MTVLPHHAPLVTMLHPGIVCATDAAGTGRRAFVSGGFVEVGTDRVTIPAERVLPVEQLTPDRRGDPPPPDASGRLVGRSGALTSTSR